MCCVLKHFIEGLLRFLRRLYTKQEPSIERKMWYTDRQTAQASNVTASASHSSERRCSSTTASASPPEATVRRKALVVTQKNSGTVTLAIVFRMASELPFPPVNGTSTHAI